MEDRRAAYRKAGVDLQAADDLMDRVKALAASTHTKGVVNDIGSFGGMFKLDLNNIANPVLVSSTDGVGTKLEIAFQMDKHDSVGIDLVGMNVNDIVVQGAKPLFLQDYFACGKLEVEKTEQVVSGIANGCRQARCALLGGETAEMPDFYAPGEYDLSGFCVGLVDNDNIVDGSSISVGNKVIGISSSGLHSNGFSLIRKLLREKGLSLQENFVQNKELGEVLLEPTRIYARTVLNLLRDFNIKGMVHITGGGLYDNVPRILPRSLQVRLDFNSWPRMEVFECLKQEAEISWEEMLQVFNCGLGLLLIVDKREYEDILIRLQGLKERSWVVGETVSRKKDQEQLHVEF